MRFRFELEGVLRVDLHIVETVVKMVTVIRAMPVSVWRNFGSDTTSDGRTGR